MDAQERYEDAVRRLAVYEYEVVAQPPGYIVQHRTDINDVSRMRNLDDLVELASLIEWREQRRVSPTERRIIG